MLYVRKAKESDINELYNLCIEMHKEGIYNKIEVNHTKSPQYGKGNWTWNKNGIIVNLNKKTFNFKGGSLYKDGRCKNNQTTSTSNSNLNNNKSNEMSSNDAAGLIAAALIIVGIASLFSSSDDESSNDSSSSSSSTSYTPSYKPCNYDDVCHRVLEVINPHRVKIQCTKGSETRRIEEMCSNSSGYWATGCGFSDIAAHHYKNLDIAGREFCN